MLSTKRTIRIIITSFLFLICVSANAQISRFLSNSAFINHNIPSYLKSGQSYNATVTMMNTGSNTWNINDDYQLILQSAGGIFDTDAWGIRNVNLPNNVSPQEKVTFNFQIRAPDRSGSYPCTWIMAIGGQSFGESTPSIVVNVSGDETPVARLRNNSEFVGQDIPSGMISGQKYNMKVTFKNTGTSVWLPNSEYKLGMYSDFTNVSLSSDWMYSPILLSQRVDPGESHTFTLSIVAPGPGSYNLQLMMMHGSNYFGEKSIVNTTVYNEDNKQKKQKKEKKNKKSKKNKKNKNDDDDDNDDDND